MPYLIHGTTQQLAKTFDKNWLVQETDRVEGERVIKNDLPRTWFLGSEEQATLHAQLWENTPDAAFYTQGDMSAQNLSFLLCDDFLFLTDNESIDDYLANQVIHSFAYITDAQQTAGFSLIYRRDDPSIWMFALAKNTHLNPHERQITLLTSFDLHPYIVDMDDAVLPLRVDKLHNLLLEQIDNTFIEQMVEHSLSADNGSIDCKYDHIRHLLRVINPLHESLLDDGISFNLITPKQIFSKNGCLDVIMNHQIVLSFKMLLCCLDVDSGLHELLAAERLTGEKVKDKCLIETILYIYEQNIYCTYYEKLTTEIFPAARAGIICNTVQIHLIPFLMKSNYPAELIQLIMSNPAYYEATSILADFNLTDEIKDFFALPNKKDELIFFATIKDNDLKKICLILWIKSTLTRLEYEEIINAGLRDHFLAPTLMALDRTGEYSITDIISIALNPMRAIRYSIITHYRAFFTEENDLNQLSTLELQRLRSSFTVLKEVKATSDRFEQAMLNTAQGHLLRMFLPSFTKMSAHAYRDQLIVLLYDGVKMNALPGTLNQKINLITEEGLLQQACLLQERLTCAIQMQQLGFSDQIIFFSTQDNATAHKFRTIILKVEAQCQLIHQRMLEVNAKKKQAQKWQNIEQEYRRELYTIAYTALNNTGYDARIDLIRAQKKALAFVDSQTEYWLYQALIVIANIFISVLTLTIANQIKYQQTNSVWFFTHSVSGEELNMLERDVSSLLKPQ